MYQRFHPLKTNLIANVLRVNCCGNLKSSKFSNIFGSERQFIKVTELSWLIFTDSISYVGGVAFGKDIGAERTPLSISSRLVSYVYSLLALIFINNYCANLMAFLLQENVGLPITGVDVPKVSAPNAYFICS